MSFSFEDKQTIVKNQTNGKVELLKGLLPTGESFQYLQTVGSDKSIFGLKGLNTNDTLKKAYELLNPEWVKISSIDSKLLNQKVWIDKEIEIIVAEINMSKDGLVVTSKNGTNSQGKELWFRT